MRPGPLAGDALLRCAGVYSEACKIASVEGLRLPFRGTDVESVLSATPDQFSGHLLCGDGGDEVQVGLTVGSWLHRLGWLDAAILSPDPAVAQAAHAAEVAKLIGPAREERARDVAAVESSRLELEAAERALLRSLITKYGIPAEVAL
jgi:hypothetical protein